MLWYDIFVTKCCLYFTKAAFRETLFKIECFLWNVLQIKSDCEKLWMCAAPLFILNWLRFWPSRGNSSGMWRLVFSVVRIGARAVSGISLCEDVRLNKCRIMQFVSVINAQARCEKRYICDFEKLPPENNRLGWCARVCEQKKNQHNGLPRVELVTGRALSNAHIAHTHTHT